MSVERVTVPWTANAGEYRGAHKSFFARPPDPTLALSRRLDARALNSNRHPCVPAQASTSPPIAACH
jgi:hypothetical protein